MALLFYYYVSNVNRCLPGDIKHFIAITKVLHTYMGPGETLLDDYLLHVSLISCILRKSQVYDLLEGSM